jgi:hypothetical protein
MHFSHIITHFQVGALGDHLGNVVNARHQIF